MHEMGITQGILATSFEAAEKAGATRITEIRITIGELTEIMDFALQFAFEALTPGTIAEGATLVVTHVSAKSSCRDCGIEYEHDRFQMLCPDCGSMNVTLLQGRELLIDSLETEGGEDSQGASTETPAEEPGETPAEEPAAPEPAEEPGETPPRASEGAAPADETQSIIGGHILYDPSNTEE